MQFDTCYSAYNAEFPQYLGMSGSGPFPIGDRIFLGWNEKLVFAGGSIRYDEFAENYWGLLGGGTRLNEVLDDPTMWRIRGYATIRDQFESFGIGAYLNARFRYEGIN